MRKCITVPARRRRPSGIDDPSRGSCPYSRGPYRKAWVQGWWAHYNRQPKVSPGWMYPGFGIAFHKGWQHFHDTHQFMAHA